MGHKLEYLHIVQIQTVEKFFLIYLHSEGHRFASSKKKLSEKIDDEKTGKKTDKITVSN